MSNTTGNVISFTVYGRPVPQGSMRSFRHPQTGAIITTSDNKRLKPWRQQVSETAMVECVGRLLPRDVPVSVYLAFSFAKPKSTKRVFPTVRPDADKLLRAILDSLTGVAFEDDAQVVEVLVVKQYAAVEQVHIQVRPYRYTTN